MQHAQAPSCTHTSTCVCTSTCAQHPFVPAFVLPFLLFPWLRVWKWLPMRSTSLAWEQKQCGEHIITSQRKTESCLPVCLRCCIRTFSASAATAVSRGQHFLQQQSQEGGSKKTPAGKEANRDRGILLSFVLCKTKSMHQPWSEYSSYFAETFSVTVSSLDWNLRITYRGNESLHRSAK